MEAEEIAVRCSHVGVCVVYRRRVMYDVYGSDIPYAEDKAFGEFVPPNADYSVVDGICRAKREFWLPWERYGETWCFGDEIPSSPNINSGRLKEILYERCRIKDRPSWQGR